MLIFGTYKPTNISNDSLLNEFYNEITFYNTFCKNCVSFSDFKNSS